MRMIAGYTAATSGRVLVEGHDMATDNAKAARQIGYLPERPPLYDALDVAAYLRFVAKVKGVPRAWTSPRARARRRRLSPRGTRSTSSRRATVSAWD